MPPLKRALPRSFSALKASFAITAMLTSNLLLLTSAHAANDWVPIASISATSALVTNSLCVTDGTDMACNGSAGMITTSGSLQIGAIGVGNLLAGNVSTTGGISATGNITANNITAGGKFFGDGSGLTGVAASNVSVTTGASGSLVYRDAYGSLLATNTLSISSTTGSVGIGAGAPSYIGNNALYVSGSIATDSVLYAAKNLVFNSNGSNYIAWTGTVGAYIFGDYPNKALAFGTSGTEALRIVSTGYVGIGTSTPNRLLTVSMNNANTATSQFNVQQLGTGNAWMNFSLGTTSSSYAVGTASDGTFGINYSSLGTGGIGAGNRLTINTSGSIGINTNYPSATLHVSGALRMADDGTACDANRTGAIKYTANEFSFCRNGTAWETLASISSGSSSPTITTGLSGSIVYRDQSGNLIANNTFSISSTTGSVGIGAGAPSYLGNNALYTSGNIFSNSDIRLNNGHLLAWGNTGTKIIGDDIGGTMSFNTSSTEALRITSNSYVGIGTSTPASKLDVVGAVAASNWFLTPYGIGYATTGGGAPSSRLDLSSPNNMQFFTSSTLGMVLTSNSYVGIGTSTPSTTFHVVGGVSGQSLMRLQRTASYAGRWDITMPYADYAIADTTGASRLYIPQTASGGGMIIGDNIYTATAPSPSAALFVSGTLRLAAGTESCDAAHNGAIKYTANEFSFCRNGTAWETLASIAAGSSASPTVTTGASGSLIYRDGTGNLLASSSLSISSTTGSVGIGAGAPGYVGNNGLYASGNIYSGANFQGSNFVPNGVGGILWGSGNDKITGDGANHYIAISTSNTEALRIVSSGNVGIGTSTPIVNLQVSGTTYIGANTGGGTLGILGNTGLAYLVHNTSQRLLFTQNTLSGGAYIFQGYDGSNSFFGNTKVGIGTTKTVDPSTSLQVSGTLQMADSGEACDANRTGAIKYASGEFSFCRNGTSWETLASISTGATSPTVTTGASGSLIYRDGTGNLYATNTLSISSTTGAVGIGAGAPASVGSNGLYTLGNIYAAGRIGRDGYMFIDQSGSVPNLRTATPGQDMTISTNAEALRITSTGQVGIGTSTPAYTLDVRGSTYVSNVTVYGSGMVVGYQGGLVNPASPTLNLSGSNTIVNAQYTNGRICFTQGNATTCSGAAGLFNVNGVFQISGSTFLGSTISLTPSTTLQVSGTLRIADGAEACDANRLGAIKYSANEFSFCRNGTSWETLTSISSGAASGDRITSGTTSVIAYNNTSLSLVTNGTERMVIDSTGRVGITGLPVNGYQLAVSGSALVRGKLFLSGSTINQIIGDSYTGSGLTGSYNVAIGSEAMQNNTGSQAVAIGLSAGKSNTADYAVMLGATSGFQNTGAKLVAVGEQSGYANTGDFSALFGYQAGRSNTGIRTIAVGYAAGQYNSGQHLIAVGNFAAQYNTGNFNIAMGPTAMQYHSTGVENVALGYQAGIGVSNTSTYARNTLVGAYSGLGLTSGSSNTIIGWNTGAGITTGNSNLVIGTNLSPYDNTGSFQLNLGNAIFGNIGSGIGNANLIGINTSSPTANLEVSGTVSATLHTGKFVGDGSGLTGITGGTPTVTTGASGSLIYRDATGNLLASSSLSISSTTGSVGIGAGAPATVVNGLYADGRIMSGAAIYAVGNIVTTAGNVILPTGYQLQWGNVNAAIGGDTNNKYLAFTTSNTEALRIVSTGLVGIGTSTPSGALHVMTSSTAPFKIGNAAGIYNYTTYMNANGTTTINAPGNVQTQFGTTAGSFNILNTTGTTLFSVVNSGSTIVSGTLKIADSGEACDANRLGAIKYSGSEFSFCRNGTSWETLASIATGAASPTVTTGASGSLIYRDGLGNLLASNSLSISSTTGSVGIGAGAPASVGANGLYVAGIMQNASDMTVGANLTIGSHFNMNNTRNINWGTGASLSSISGNSTVGSQYLTFNTSSTEAMRIVSTGYVGLGTTAPVAALQVSGTIRVATDGTTTYTYVNRNGIHNASGFMYINTDAVTGSTWLGGTGNKTAVGLGSIAPSTTLHVSGTLRIANGGESCDTNRLGAIMYTGNEFSFCRNGTAWETLASIGASATPTITTGLSGSLVYRDQNGLLLGHPTISISSTTGSVGIGAGAPATVGNDGLFVSGTTIIGNGLRIVPGATTVSYLMGTSSGASYWRTSTGNYLMSLTSTGALQVGLAPAATVPSATLTVSGTIKMADSGEACDANRLGAMKYASSEFSFCRNGTAWETLSSIGGASVPTGVSGSIVYRDQSGNLSSSSSFLISSTTGSVVIGGGASTTGNNGLYAQGIIQTATYFSAPNNGQLFFGSTGTSLSGSANNGLLNLSINNNNIMRLVSSGLVGIGTITPTTALEVAGTVSATTFTINGSAGATLTNNGLTFGRNVANQLYASNPSGYLQFLTGGSISPRLTILANGQVGISTTSPNAALEVNGTVSATQFVGDGSLLTNLPGGATDRITSSTSGVFVSNTGVISLNTAGSTPGYINAAGLVINGISSTGTISGTTGYFSGNVGIGTLPGSVALSVGGVVQAVGMKVAGGTGYQFVNDTTSGIYGGTGQYLMFATSSTEALRIVSTGYVGIGTSAPTVQLHVLGSGANARVGVNSNYFTNLSPNSLVQQGAPSFIVNSSNAAYLSLQSGNTGTVGIGLTTQPSATLNIAGSLRLAAETSTTMATCDTNRAGAIKFDTGAFYTCDGTTGWKSISTGTPAISTGLSGSIVYRDSTGNLISNGTFSISSTTGSVGIGAGAPASLGNNSLYLSGALRSVDYIQTGGGLRLGDANHTISADITNKYMAFTVNNTEAMRIISDTSVAIGSSTSSGYKLYVAGNAYSTGTWGTSDVRYKENIQPMTGLLAKVTQLRPVNFTWKKTAPGYAENPGEQIGLIAQEVEKIYPELVHTGTNGYKAVAYDKLGVLLLGAVKDLKSQNDQLRTENEALKTQQLDILHRLETLEHTRH